MRINIDVEIAQHEIPLAAELFEALRAFGANVRIRAPGVNGNGQPSLTDGQSFQQPQIRAAAPPLAAPPAVQQQQAYGAAQQQAAAAPPQQQAYPSAPKGASRAEFDHLLSQLVDESKHEQIFSELSVLMAQPQRLQFGPEDLADAHEALVLNSQLVLQNQSVVPLMALISRLPDAYKGTTRDRLISKALQHLNKKRPVSVDRTLFFVHAEAFAMLVKMEFVSVDGAAQTIEKLLNKAESRSAAVTMLGKTVEMCSDKLLAKCNPSYLQALFRGLDKVTEEIFKYDVDWITSGMGWPPVTGAGAPGAAAPAASASAPSSSPSAAQGGAVAGPTPHTLTAVSQLVGHRETIFSLCYDSQHRQLVSGGKDGNVVVWDDKGAIVHRIDIPVHYVCSMDIHPRNNMLLICGVAKDAENAPVPPCIAVFDTNRSWQSRGMLSKPNSTLISCLRCMGTDSDGFITGETVHGGPTGLQEQVCYYDMARSPSLEALQPVHTYKEHDNLVTCVAVQPNNSNIFVSGSRDQTVRAWDRRSERSVGMFGTVDSGTAGQFKVVAHADMITCLDAVDNLLLSTGVDGFLCWWDFRQLGSSQQACAPITRISLDGSPILKVALAGAPYPNIAAVSTFQGVYIVDFTHISSPSIHAASTWTDNRDVKPYHDIKWGAGTSVLYAACEHATIDVFNLMA